MVTIKPSSDLSSRGEEIFNELLSLLDHKSLEIDAYELTLLAGYLDDYERICRKINLEENPYQNKHGQVHPLQTQRNKTIDIILKLGDRFGMNPMSRMKGKEAFKKEKKFDTPLDGFKKKK
jgi:phage terminase small subunit